MTGVVATLAAAALRYHVVDVLHDLVQTSIGAGTDEGLDKHAAAALLYHAVDGSNDLVFSSSDVGTEEGLNRHVLAGSMFSGTGEQASRRVDVPGKDKQQQAAAAKDFICFFVLCRQDGTPGHCRTGQATRCTQVWGL